MLLIAEIIDIRRFPRFDELCSYTGFIPTSRSTGEKENMGELTSRKNQRIMPALVQSSWVSTKSDPELLMKYENYRKKMGGQKAIIKIARILRRRIQVIWSKEILYQKAEC
jgi:transposase